MPKTASCVFVIDDDPSVRKSLLRLLNSAEYKVEAFSSADDFLKRQKYNGIGCMILDIKMPGLSGLELQKELSAKSRILPIIFITGHGDIPTSVKAMKSGAIDFLPKPFRSTDLLEAVNRGIEKHRKIRALHFEKQKFLKLIEKLTLREKDVFAWVVKGLLNKQIAMRLNIAEKTVKIHRGRIMHKMKVHSVAELVHISEVLSTNLFRTRL